MKFSTRFYSHYSDLGEVTVEEGGATITCSADYVDWKDLLSVSNELSSRINKVEDVDFLKECLNYVRLSSDEKEEIKTLL